jgi:cyclophilin family peptidyl-prolyl cis-trans isomerase
MPRRCFVFALLVSHAQSSVKILCETTVKVGDGVLEIELWSATAPIGVRRVIDLVNDEFFTDLPFFHAHAHMVLFGLQPDAEKQKRWDRKGDILDDRWPATHGEPAEGVMCFSGDPAKRDNSRSTLFLLTLGPKGLMSNRKTPWEVPVGKVVKGLDVLRGIYTGMRWARREMPSVMMHSL